MLGAYMAQPRTHDEACRLLEALCEGYVRAMMEEIDGHPEGEFPCCIKCGGFGTRNAPLTPAQAESIEETLEHGHPVSGAQRLALGEILESHGYGAPIEEIEEQHGAEPVTSNPAQWWSSDQITDEVLGGQVRVRSAREILRNKGGTTIELACYQCAQKRREGSDPGARVVVVSTWPGTFRGAVLQSEHHAKPHKRGRIDDPVVDARPIGGCGCGVGYEEG